MITRSKFITNSSSSCMIRWEMDPYKFPTDMIRYDAGNCPHCGKHIALNDRIQKLDVYIDDKARKIVMDKIARGCAVFYDIQYMCTFPEDEVEHGTEDSGWYSFQC